MKAYLDTLSKVLKEGKPRTDRTGTGTISLFGTQTRYDLRDGFPAVTTKRLAWKSVVSELLWFLEGSTDERRLVELTFEKPRAELTDKKTVWTANADKQGVDLGYENNDKYKELGPVYGAQWRDFNDEDVDQIADLITGLKEDPYGRRHILTAWNPARIKEMTLPPCHMTAQFYVSDDQLSCQLYQRSADMFLGVPFNIASYALLTHMLAKLTGLGVGEFIHTIGDAHIYHNHVSQVKTQLVREPIDPPNLVMPEFNTLDELLQTTTSDYILDGYEHWDPIKAPMAV